LGLVLRSGVYLTFGIPMVASCVVILPAMSSRRLIQRFSPSIKYLKLKLEGLEGTLSEVRAGEETLTKNLEKERQLRKNETANHEDFVKGENLWISRLADVAGRITTQLATMGMPNVRYTPERNMSPNAKLTIFFEGVLGALEQLHYNRAASLADESWRL